MTLSAIALRAGLYEALTGHAPLVALLGGPKVYDEAPRAASFPYVTLGEAQTLDFSTGTSAGHEHRLALHVWSRKGGQREAHAVTGAILAALEDDNLTLVGHRLVNLAFSAAEVRREKDGETWHGLVRFRAVTEPA